jgi:sugar-specific transcriptional regulator TrmB
MMFPNNQQLRVFSEIVRTPSTIGKLAQMTGMHRRSVKIIIKSLIDKGFVAEKKEGNRIFYHAADLRRIKRKYLTELDSIKLAIPGLSAAYEETKDSQVINLLKGRYGLRSVLLDEIIKGKEVCSFQLSGIRPEYADEYHANADRRKKLGIHLRVLTPFAGEQYPLSTVRKTRMKGRISAYVYSNKTTFVYDSAEQKILTVKIPEINGYFRELFENEWKKRILK